MIIYELLLYISIFSSFIPLFCFIYSIKYASPKIGLALFVLSVFTFVTEFFGQILIKNGFENIILANIYVVLSPLIIYSFYKRNLIFKYSNFLLSIYLIISIIFSIYMIFTSGIFNGFFKSLFLTQQLILCSITLFYIFLNRDFSKSNQFLSILNYAFLINCTLSFFSVLFLDFFVKWKMSINVFMIAWSIVLINSIIFNLVISLGIWKTRF